MDCGGGRWQAQLWKVALLQGSTSEAEGAFLELCLGRVLLNVAAELFHRRPTSHKVVEALVLPERPAFRFHGIDPACGELFPRANNLSHVVIACGNEKSMDVVWHDDVVAELIPRAVEIEECRFDDGGVVRIHKEATAVAGIKKFVEARSEAAEVFPAIFLREVQEQIVDVTFGGIKAVEKPDATLGVPLFQGGLRNRVGEAEGGEGDDPGSIPVREVSAMGFSGKVGIEEAEGLRAGVIHNMGASDREAK